MSPVEYRSPFRARARFKRESRSRAPACGCGRKPAGPKGQVWRIDPVVFGEQSVLHTATDGRFQTPAGVPAGLEYEATVTAPNATPGRTGWLKTGSGKRRRLPMSCCIASERWRASCTTARASRSKASPCSSPVTARCARAPLTDARGRFRLPGVIAGKAILFARKDGFRFHGQPIDTEAGAARSDSCRESKRRPRRSRRSTALCLIRKSWRSLDGCLLRTSKRSSPRAPTCRSSRRSCVLAQVDPARALELLDAHSAGKPQFAVDSSAQHGRHRDGEPEPRRSREHRGIDPGPGVPSHGA